MSEKATVLRKAEFNPRLKTYLVLYTLFVMITTVIGILFIPFWAVLAPILTRKYFDRLECELTTRSLRFKKGFIFQTEKTIPLDKIQDLTFKEGPLLKKLGLSVLKIETAGNSAQTGSDLTLIGIVDAHEFRSMVFDQRDKVTDNQSGKSHSEDDSMIEILSDIRDSIKRIESHLKVKP